MHVEMALLRSTPEEKGVDSITISRFLERIEEEKIELHSFMMARHGSVIAEGWWTPYKPDYKHMLFSMTKSFTALAMGFAISEGLVSLEEEVRSFFPGMKKRAKSKFREIRVKDLLTMSVGHTKPTMGGELRQLQGSWVEHFFQLAVEHEPGIHFQYNSLASHMVSAIIQQATGLKMADYLQPRLFDPLGIMKPSWDTSPEGNTTGGGGLSLKTEDIAKFGQFILQKGSWKGKQLLPAAWVEEATACQITTGDSLEDQQSYGYQFWRCRHDAYRADGKFGQLCIVMPAQDTVIAITSGCDNAGKILDQVWENLFPAIRNQPLQINEQGHKSLITKMSHRILPIPSYPISTSPISSNVSGKIFRMDENLDHVEEIVFVFGADFCQFRLKDDQGEHEILCGYQTWLDGTTTMTGHNLHHHYQPDQLKVSARAGWRNQHELELTWCFVETPFTDTVVCHFQGNRLSLNRSVNTDKAVERPTIYGKWI
ncbi:hypothetical protein J14TS2_19030 [Bacillus sp. J14TS2]|uniref:serine hydrolase domain-containing protein n=1 Tax=Bacillus sp. J14TS2 TaxID=2807188 RepID=UPI001B22535C|nr:serine hydrolase [Bacillus sp. J14TS2]GIN71428.1 hypothetical protein J14TS2_19030 [Bacillus sp. J14TS2]